MTLDEVMAEAARRIDADAEHWLRALRSAHCCEEIDPDVADDLLQQAQDAYQRDRQVGLAQWRAQILADLQTP
jgi:hypothetical protein